MGEVLGAAGVRAAGGVEEARVLSEGPERSKGHVAGVMKVRHARSEGCALVYRMVM